LAPYGITVNNYSPGMVATPMFLGVDGGLREHKGGEVGEHQKKFESSILLGRLGEPEDIAKFVSYLASEGCDYITGQSMMIDGGVHLT
jgi:meso-butanediol dehydrogenase / (S,S)-butanediol dehydrogenase / diacetyl reductase